MFEKLWNAQTVAARRRVHLTFRDSTTGDNKDPGSLTGKKASIRLDGTGTLVTSTNDLVALNQTDHLGAGYIEFTAAELTAFASGELIISVSGITGVKVEDAQATLYPFDPFDPGATAASIASAILVTPSNKVATSSDGSVQLTVADEAQLAKLDATISSRASASALAAGVTLTAGERTATTAVILATVVEANGGRQLTVKQILQLIAAFVMGKLSGITAGTGPQTTILRSATDLQTILTYTDDDLGNRTNVVETIP